MYILKELLKDKESTPKAKATTPKKEESKLITDLERNFLRLKTEIKRLDDNLKTCAIVGQPGTGKSTLISVLTNRQCRPLPKIGQSTDTTNWSSGYNIDLFLEYKNFRFIDTPGYDTFKHPVDSYIQYFPFTNVSYIIFLVKGKIHQADEELFSHIYNRFFIPDSAPKKIILVRSISEDLSESQKREIADDFERHFNISDRKLKLVFLSSRSNHGVADVSSFISLV